MTLFELVILDITPVEARGALKAYVNIQLGDLVINDCRIIQEPGKKPWFSLPVLTYKNQYGTTQYRTLIQIKNQNLKNKLSEDVLSAWENNGRRQPENGTTQK